MKTNLKQTVQTVVGVMLLALVLGSCGGKKRNNKNFDYLPVQMTKGDSWSIIDKDGKEVVKEEYPSDAVLSLIYDGVFWVKQGDKYQLYSIDDPKKPIIDEEFSRATDFAAGVAVVSNPNQQIRIINTSGNTVATLGKDIKRCLAFNEEGYALVVDANEKCGVIDVKGNLVVKPSHANLWKSGGELIFAQKNNDDKTILIIDMKGNKKGEINQEKYDILNWQISEDKIIVKNAGDDDACLVVLDKTGKKLFDIKKARAQFYSESYSGGYLTFKNADNKYGVADDKGEIVIRPKYDAISNYGNGEFAAKKGDKWGVVNAKDETIIDFDYDDAGGMMGSNYIMEDGNSFSLLGKDGKEITSFDIIKADADSYAEYVDVTSLTNGIYNSLEEYEKGMTAAQLAKQLSLDIDNYHYRSYIDSKLNIDNKVTVEWTSCYGNNVAEEKTHEEQVNDGWFTYNRTVSDGWQWNTNHPGRIGGDVKLSDNSVNIKDIYSALVSKLAEGRKKVSDNVYSKNIKVGGKTVECLTELTNNGDNLSIAVTFKE